MTYQEVAEQAAVYAQRIMELEEEVQYLKDMGEIMLAVIKQLKEGYDGQENY